MAGRHKVKPKNKLTKIIEKKVERRVESKHKHSNNWRMTSFFGLIGFSVVIPLALAMWFGVYLDKQYPGSRYSFTILGIIAGLMIGGFNAWRWIQKEEKVIEKE